jgi:hypothetical protein
LRICRGRPICFLECQHDCECQRNAFSRTHHRWNTWHHWGAVHFWEAQVKTKNKTFNAFGQCIPQSIVGESVYRLAIVDGRCVGRGGLRFERLSCFDYGSARQRCVVAWACARNFTNDLNAQTNVDVPVPSAHDLYV